MRKVQEWINKGDGGEWYEPYITNKILILIAIITLITCSIIVIGCLIFKNI